MTQEKDSNARYHLANALAAVAAWMVPNEAARLLHQALAQEQDGDARKPLAQALAAAAGRFWSSDAARMCMDAARSDIAALDPRSDIQVRYAMERVSLLMQPLDSEGARHAGGVFARRIVSDANLDYLVAILSFCYETDVLERY